MKYLTRSTVGVFGFLFHVAAAGLFAVKAARAAQGDPGSVFMPAAAAAVAAFAVYALLVTPYARRRYGNARKGVVFFDFLIGMLAEVAIVAVAALLFAIFSSGAAYSAQGVSGAFSHVVRTAALSFLWAVGTAMTEILALGNGAGFAGYIALKKLAAREAAAGERVES